MGHCAGIPIGHRGETRLITHHKLYDPNSEMFLDHGADANARDGQPVQ